MTANLDLLDTLRSHGITLTVNGDALVAKPAANVTEQIVSMIRERKPQLIGVLQGDVARCEHCGGSVVRDRTFDGYWNRYCVNCGRWFNCEKDVCNGRDGVSATGRKGDVPRVHPDVRAGQA